MTNAKHTPAPWSYTSRGDIIGEGATLAVVSSSPITISKNEEKANARLIAAAPELLEALRFIRTESCRSIRIGALETTQ